ncbi:MAG: polyphenol oxidase family protein [Polyangiaceae bacterium]|jgi:YfiH family protein
MSILRSRLLEQAGFRHTFPERTVGDADLLAALDVGAITQVKQVHGARAVEAIEASGAEADALVARASPGAEHVSAIGVRVADCVPILVGDRVTGDVAAIHAGWRGVVAGVVGAALARMQGSSLVAAIGPCIGGCCFEVGGEVAEAIARVVSADGVVARHAFGKAFVDLRAAVRAQLRAVGVPNESVEDVLGCTRHEPFRFHSFRRDGPNSGRMLAAIAVGRRRGIGVR